MFESILYWFYGWLNNYGLAVIAFTILVRLVLLPFDYKSRVSMRKISKLQPKMQALQKKYANDKEKLNRKMSELYKTARVSPLSGCVPMLLSYPILIIMFNAMRNVANQEAVRQALNMLQGEDPGFLNFLWIKNLVMADSPMASTVLDARSLMNAGSDVWVKLFTERFGAEGSLKLSETLTLTVESFSKDNLSATAQSIYEYLETTTIYQESTAHFAPISLLLFNITVYKIPNGFFILPIMSASSQFLMTKIVGGNQQQPAANDQQAQTQQATGKFMKWFFPIFSLWICSSSTAAFALYWVASNLIAMVSTIAINKYLDKKEQKDVIAGEGIVQ